MTTKAPPPAKVQPDDVPIGLLFGLLSALIVVVLIVLALVWQVFGSTADQVLQEQFLGKPDRVLERVTKRNRQLVLSYGVVHAAKGIYRVPVSRAMRLLLAQPKLLAPRPMPPKKAEAAATPAGALGPANGRSAAKPSKGQPAKGQPAKGQPAQGQPAKGQPKAKPAPTAAGAKERGA